MPVYNEKKENFLKCIKSLQKQIFKNFECIIVDDSTNNTCKNLLKKISLNDKRFIYIKPKKRAGLARSLNLGIQKSKGEFIARVDSDDTSDRKRFLEQVKFLKKNSEIGVVGSWIKLVDKKNRLLGIRKYKVNHQLVVKDFRYTNGMAHPTVMIRKEILRKEMGPYNVKFRFCEDLELWLRLINKKIKFSNLPKALVTYCQSDQFVRSNLDNKFNLKARLMYIKSIRDWDKAMFIVLLSLWLFVPTKLKQVIYKKVIISRY